MKKKVLSLLAFLPAFTTVMAQQTAEVPDVCAFVNPIIGTCLLYTSDAADE